MSRKNVLAWVMWIFFWSVAVMRAEFFGLISEIRASAAVFRRFL